MTIETKKEFEKQLKDAILKDEQFKDLVVSVRAIDQLSNPDHPNNVRFEVYVLINGYVNGLPCRDED